MIDLIRKRHEGDGWIVFTELANRPGFAAKRYADAFALGVWASTKYEGHLYEEKISREDLKKELRDPEKAEAVGKYARYRWLVVGDEKITEGLVIPDVWGILTPHIKGGSKILRVVRKAPKLEPREIDAGFAMAMIRNGLRTMVTAPDHGRVVEELFQLKQSKGRPAMTGDRESEIKIIALEREIKDLRANAAHFEEMSGVKLDLATYRAGNIGAAVKLVLEMQEHGNAIDHLGQYVHKLSTVAAEHEHQAKTAAAGAVRLRHALGMVGKDHTQRCLNGRQWSPGRCTCGAIPTSGLEADIQRDMMPALESTTPAEETRDEVCGDEAGDAGGCS